MTTATVTQAEIDTETYAAYLENGENKAATGRALSINESTVAARIKRHQLRQAQDAASEPETAEQTEAERLAAKYGAMDTGAKTEAQRLSSKYGDVTAQPGPGQADDNIVHQMTCGHEYDSPVELAPGQSVQCSAHGQTEIAGGQEPEPDTADDPQAQAERDALMDQACGTCGVEVDHDGGEVEHLDNCPDAPPAEVPAAPESSPAKAGRFPQGVVTPNEFRAALVAEGIVPEKSVHYLGYKLANENPGSFPARWYAKDGTSYDYDGRQPGARLGIHLDGGREWVKNRPAKPARQPRPPKVKTVLFEGGKPSARLAELLGSDGGGQAELTSADVNALYAAYASMTAAGGTLRGFAGWLGEIG